MKRILSIITGITIMLSTGFSLPIFAEEPIKNFDYYWHLDNYSVYKEYMEVFGYYDNHEPSTTLPKEQDLPMFFAAKHYFTHGYSNYTVIMPFIVQMKNGQLTNESLGKLMEDPSYFGFPKEWYIEYDNDKGMSVLQPEQAFNDQNIIGFRFDILSTYGNEKMPVIHSTLDLYRLQLTLEHSDFAKDYMEYDRQRGHYCIGLDIPMGECCVFGDLNEDGLVNAKDAAVVLIEAAKIGTGIKSQLTTIQLSAADVNGDQIVNANDASIILQYSAAIGTGERYARMRDYIK